MLSVRHFLLVSKGKSVLIPFFFGWLCCIKILFNTLVSGMYISSSLKSKLVICAVAEPRITLFSVVI